MGRTTTRRTDDERGSQDQQGRLLGFAVLLTLSIVFAAVSVLQFRILLDASPTRQLSVVGFAVYSVSLLAGSYWLYRQNYGASDVWRVVGWCLLGIVPIGLLAVLTVSYQQALGVDIAYAGLSVVQLSGAGALGGMLTGVYDVHRTVEHRKHRAVSERMEAIVAASPVALVSVAPDGRVESWNRAAAETFGYAEQEIVGDTYPLVSPDAEPTVTLDDIVGSEPLDGVETVHVRRDGRLVDVRIWTAPIADTSGTVVALVDVTHRKQRRRELRMFQQAVEEATNSIILTDDNGTIEYVNPAFEAATGYDAMEAIGKTPAIVKSGKQSDAFYDELWNTILDGREWHANIVNRRKSGELYEVRQTITPITDEEGNVERFVAIEDDVSVQIQRRQQLQVLQRVLRHNLGNDMTVLLGHAQELLERETIANDPDLRESVEQMIETAEDLLDLSETVRLTRQALPDERTSHDPIDVRTLVSELSADVRADFPEATIHETTPDVARPVDGTIEPAIEELLANAVRHSDRTNPRVEVSVSDSADGHWVEVAIADDGPGIPVEEREVLERGEETALMHGSGLGLWLVNWVTRTIGGEISIADNDPRGSVVTLRVPVWDDATENQTVDLSAEPPTVD